MSVVLRLVVLALLVPAAAVLAIAAHELGHALGGRLGGLRLFLFTAGPVRVQRAPDGRLRWGRVETLGAAGGMVLSVPRRAEGLRRSLLLFVAGGPGASLAAGALALAAYLWLDLDAATWARDAALKAAAAGVFTFAATSLALGMGTAAPYRVQGMASDGRRLLTLLRPGAEAERHAALMALGAWLTAGTPPRDWDRAVVARALAPGDDGSFDAVLARYLAYLHALDREDPDAAGEHVGALAGGVDEAPEAFRPVIRAEAAYFDAAYRGDAASARARLACAGASPMLDAHTLARAETAVLLAGEDPERGREGVRALHAQLAAAPASGSSFQLDELRRLCRSRGLPDPAAAPPFNAT